jgi:cytochrome c peroxidase
MNDQTTSRRCNGRKLKVRRAHRLLGLTAAVLTMATVTACSDSDSSTIATNDSAGAAGSTDAPTGEQLFNQPLSDSNGRACATCHVPEDDFTLTPEHVAQVLTANPKDPLFAAIDADDPTAEPPTFEHLKKGLVRVWLTLPDNMDLIDQDGTVVTPDHRKMFVWRSVPSIADAALTAPYQPDGRFATLEEQAQGAIAEHLEGKKVSKQIVEGITEFERGLFSSDRAQQVAKELADGVPFPEVSKVEDSLELTEQEMRGKALYEAVCANCHGGANTSTIIGREIHDQAFFALKSDGSGNVQYQVPATDPPTHPSTCESATRRVHQHCTRVRDLPCTAGCQGRGLPHQRPRFPRLPLSLLYGRISNGDCGGLASGWRRAWWRRRYGRWPRRPRRRRWSRN